MHIYTYLSIYLSISLSLSLYIYIYMPTSHSAVDLIACLPSGHSGSEPDSQPNGSAKQSKEKHLSQVINNPIHTTDRIKPIIDTPIIHTPIVLVLVLV